MKDTDRHAQDGTTPHRIVVVPRRGAREQDDWCPWLQAELAGSSTFAPVVIGDMPDPDEPTIDRWGARRRARGERCRDPRRQLERARQASHPTVARSAELIVPDEYVRPLGGQRVCSQRTNGSPEYRG